MTFGNTDIMPPNVSTVADLIVLAGPYQAQPATLSQLRAYLAGGSDPTSIKAVVYSDDAGEPGTLAAVSTETSVAAALSERWVEFDLPAAIEIEGEYWLGLWFDDDSAFFAATPDQEGFGRFRSPTPYAGAVPDPFGLSTDWPFETCIYAPLTPITDSIFSLYDEWAPLSRHDRDIRKPNIEDRWDWEDRQQSGLELGDKSDFYRLFSR